MRKHILGISILTLLLAAGPMLAEEPLMISSSSSISFGDKALGAGTLTVSLPDHSSYRMEFKSGEKPFFSLFGADGEVRPDGTYTWEIVPTLSEAKGERGSYQPRRTISGSFSIRNGVVVDKNLREAPATKDQQILDDLIVQGSICAGFDCSNGESFGFDTLVLKENNLRIFFNDTSNTASFPSNDWRLVANDTSNGGQNKFAIEDSTAGRTPFTVENGAGNHAIYIDAGGEIGFGTSTPVVELHAVSGDTPTLRLEQDGSSGFTPQTFDLAANETNFFIRDATNGSTLPFRIRPSAPQSALDIAADGDIGMGTASPSAALHVRRTGAINNATFLLEGQTGATGITVQETNATVDNARQLLVLENNGSVRIRLSNTNNSDAWVINGPQGNGNLSWNNTGNSGDEFTFTDTGSLEILGSFVAGGMTLNVPDYVFEEDYSLMPLAELQTFIEENKHLPNVPSAEKINAGKLDMTQMQMTLLEKVEELTLYTLDQEETIRSQVETLSTQQQLIEALQSRLSELEAKIQE